LHEVPIDCDRRREAADRRKPLAHPSPHVGGYESREISALEPF
jgi:hypothetical protein